MTYDFTKADDIRRAIVETERQALDRIHCPRCRASRRVDLSAIAGVDVSRIVFGGQIAMIMNEDVWDELPLVVKLTCRQCAAAAIVVVYAGPDGEQVGIHWSHAGGLATPHTPAGVSYYLDQAARCEATGARSAAMAMYRAAIEYVLLDQGYTDRMLGPKIGHLLRDVSAGAAKPWATGLAPGYLEVLKDLGNAAIHSDDGDVSKQATLDSELIGDVRTTVEELLDVIYERPKNAADRLARLQTGAAKMD